MDVRRIFTGINLIAIGLVLFANTLGTLPWSVWWNVFSLWPLLVVSFGLDIMSRSLKTPWLEVLGSLILLGGLAYATLVMPAEGAAGLTALSVGPTQSFSQGTGSPATGSPYPPDSPATLAVTLGAGDIVVGPGPGPGRGTADYRVLASISGRAPRGHVPRLTVDASRKSRVPGWPTPLDVSVNGADPSAPLIGTSLGVALSPDAQWRSLVFETGGASLSADLRQLHVAAVAVKTGASTSSIRLGAKRDCIVTVQSGAANVQITVPWWNSDVTIVDHSALVGKQFTGFTRVPGTGPPTWRRYVQSHGGYTGPPVRIHIELQMGVGTVWVAPDPNLD
jgi:hypothetical protein